MEELYQSITQRFNQVSIVLQDFVSSDSLRNLKQQEKNRCEKELFILTMLKASRNGQTFNKKHYFEYSYQIMKKISPQFVHHSVSESLEDNFLNDFVGLYCHFFSKFQEKFQFKIKIQSLIRPTNHNLIIDLIKYLVDFSRDYYQQAFFWQMRKFQRNHQDKEMENAIQKYSTEEINKTSTEGINKNSTEGINKTSTEGINKNSGQRTSLNELILQKISVTKKTQQTQQSATNEKAQLSTYYNILQISLPSIANIQKDQVHNSEILKIRINQLYREMKSRNQLVKTLILQYANRYHLEKNVFKFKENYQTQDSSLNRATHPFKLALVMEKNGFSYIAVTISENKTYFNRNKDKKLSPLKNLKTTSHQQNFLTRGHTKADFLLTSLKVLRISENFLPPLLNFNNIPNNCQPEKYLPPNRSTRINLISSNSTSTKDEEFLQDKMKRNEKVIVHHMESQPNIIEEKIVKCEKSKKRLSDMKKNFSSEDKKEKKSTHNDPEEKILIWLDKIKQVKELERMKIMGLS